MRTRKRKISTTTIIVLLIFIVATVLLLAPNYKLLPLDWIPGLEGAKCTLHGVRFVNQFPSDWTGANLYHPITEGDGYDMVTHAYMGYSDNCYWMDASPSSALIAWDYHYLGGAIDRQIIRIETESHVQLQNLNAHGDPLGWTTGTPTTIRDYVQYQANEERTFDITEAGDKTNYELKKLSILLVPATIHITFSIPPENNNAASHKSGWQEGDWYGCKFWFKLDFHTWETVSDPYAEDDQMSEWEADYWISNPASEFAYNKRAEYDDKGGFPLCGWIQGYYENVDDSWDDEIWWEIPTDKPSARKKYREDHAGAPAQLDAKTSTNPELNGRYLDLFTIYDETSSETHELVGYDAIRETARTYDWADAQAPAYFSIMVTSLGTYAEQDNALAPWHIWYPAINIELRVIWAVFGHFTYLWTVETAKANQYPGWETRKYEEVIVPQPWQWLLDLLTNPFFLFWLFLVVILVILVLLAVFAPGVLKLVSAVGKRGAEKVSKKSNVAYFSIGKSWPR